MYTNVIVPRRQWSRLVCLCRSASSVESQKLPQPNAALDGLSPSPRVPRGPTDLLRALAVTVGPDPTAAHYKYHDDPYLIPLSNYRKRAYALSAEAGRKAAAWVRDQHAPLFTLRTWDPPTKLQTPHYNAEPHIDAFAPKPIYTDDSQVTEEDLKYTIENALVEDAVKVFQLLGGVEGGAVGADLQLQLLQLLCFYNERQPDAPDWLEERWFAAAHRERQAATWRLGGLADKIFSSMDPKTPEAYCAIIQGMAKYYQAERAHALSAEALGVGVRLGTRVYNALIGCVGFLVEGAAQRVDRLNELLAEMNQQGLSPDEQTLSAALRSLSLWGAGRALQHAAMQLLADARALGIRPTLAAYYHLLCLFCKERGPRVDILSGVLAELESRPRLAPVGPHDTSFFVTAMGVCSDHLQNVAMADRVHALLMKADNYRLVGDAYKESIYYRHYVTAVCKHAPLEQAVQLLDTLVPHVYVPEPSVVEVITVTLEAAGAGARLAGLWPLLVTAGHAHRARLVDRLLAALLSCYSYQDEEVKAKMRQTAADILKFGQAQDELTRQRDLRTPNTLTLSADSLSAIAVMCSDVAGVDGETSEAGWAVAGEAVRRLQRGGAHGVPSDPAAVAGLAERAARCGKHGLAAMVVSYLAASGFPQAEEAALSALGVVLNRPPDELHALLAARPHPSALSPAALDLFEAYHLARSGGAGTLHASSSSSSSEDEDEDDE